MWYNFQKGSVIKLIRYAIMADMRLLIKTEGPFDKCFESIQSRSDIGYN